MIKKKYVITGILGHGFHLGEIVTISSIKHMHQNHTLVVNKRLPTGQYLRAHQITPYIISLNNQTKTI